MGKEQGPAEPPQTCAKPQPQLPPHQVGQFCFPQSLPSLDLGVKASDAPQRQILNACRLGIVPDTSAQGSGEPPGIPNLIPSASIGFFPRDGPRCGAFAR